MNLRISFLLGVFLMAVTLKAQPPVRNLKDTVSCYNPYVTLDAGNAGATYLWSTGDTTRHTTVSFSGIYTVEITRDGHSIMDTVSVGFPFNNAYNNNWMLTGKMGVNFNKNKKAPTAKENEVVITGTHSGAVSDKDGNLWFYINNKSLYNNKNKVIKNSEDIITGLLNEQTIFCHYPGNDNMFYIFSLTSLGGVYYSILDMSKNGGEGEVIKRNDRLNYPKWYVNQGAIIRHQNLKDFWLVLKDHDNVNENSKPSFSSFLITETGLSNTPVQTQAGFEVTGTIELNASSDGRSLILSTNYPSSSQKFELLQFDPATGKVSNPLIFYMPDAISGPTHEFSYDGKKLYIYLYRFVNGYKKFIYQYDLSGWNVSTIIGTETLIASDPYNYGMEMGADGKLYIASFLQNHNQHLTAISEPNLSGMDCKYDTLAISFNGNVNGFLPMSRLVPNFDADCEIKGKTLLCSLEDSVVYKLEGNSNLYKWRVEGSAILRKVTDTTLIIDFIKDGTVNIIGEGRGCLNYLKKSLIVNIKETKFSLGNDTLVCGPITNYKLTPGSGFETYSWQDRSTQSVYSVTKAGTYIVNVSFKSCRASDTIIIKNEKIPYVDLKDTTICDNQIMIFDAGDNYESYLWQDNSSQQKIITKIPGQYKVVVTNICGIAKDSAILKVNPTTSVSFTGLDSTYCFSRKRFQLTASPMGGIFSGPGVIEDSFIPGMADYGKNKIEYTYTNSYGCTSKDAHTVNVNDDCLFLPNLITFNNDSYNEKFVISGIPENSHLEIFDKWGSRVYFSDNYSDEFDGDNISSGVYYFSLTTSKSNREVKGWVHVIKE